MRYVVCDKQGLYKQIQNLDQQKQKVAFIEEDEFFDRITKPGSDIFLAYGRPIYDVLVELHKTKGIHIGLRNFKFTSFCALPSVYIGEHKLVFGEKPVIENDTDTNYKLFISKYIEKEQLELPETHNIGLKEGLEILKTYFEPDLTSWVGLDFETSGFPNQEKFDISGFSLYKGDQAYFFDFRKDYDYNISRKYDPTIMASREKFLEAFRQYMSTHAKNIWSYNCGFEMQVLFRLYQQFFYIQDTYALTTADDRKGTLKYNVQYYLHCPSWDDVLDIEQEYIREIQKNNKTYQEFFNNLYIYKTNPEAIEELKGLYKEACQFYVDALDTNPLLIKMLEWYWNGRPDWFACDPDKLGTYCCYDSFYCVKLAELIFPAYGSNCYLPFLFNKYLGMELEISGIQVDREKALKYAKYCQNICSNTEIFLNKIYLRGYLKHNQGYKLDIPEKTLDIIAKYPEICQVDPVKVTKGLLKRLCPATDNWSIPDTLLDTVFNCDLSDELMCVLDQDAMKEGFDAYTRRKKTAEPIGKLAQNLVNLQQLVQDFNRSAIKLVKEDLDKKKQEVRKIWSWIENIVRIEDAWIVVDVTKSWFKKYGLEIEVAGKKEPKLVKDTIKKAYIKARDEGYKVSDDHLDEFRDDHLKWLLKMAEDAIEDKKNKVVNLFDKLDQLRDLDDPYYLNLDLTSWLPKDIVEKFNGIDNPDISAYRYIKFLAFSKEAEEFDTSIRVTEDPFVHSIYHDQDELYIDRVCKYGSNDQFPDQFGRMIESEYKDQILVMRSAWEFIKDEKDKQNYNEAWNTIKGLEQNLEILYKSEIALDLFTPEEVVDTVWDRETRGTIEIKARKPVVWKKEFLSDHSSYIEMFFQYLFKDPRNSLTTEIPNDPYLLLAKLGMLLNFGAVADKELNTYVCNLLKGCHKIFYPNCHSGVFSDEGGKETYLPDFHMNTLVTKRSASGYHTFSPHSDTLKCLVAEPGRIKTYFDVSQMEPRSICYISKDPVFMDIYNSGKDAYMELAKITWPDKVNEPNFRDNYRGIAKVCMISSIYGQGDAGLALRAKVSTSRVTEMKNAMFGAWKEVARLREHKLHYLKQTGEIETFLGDRLIGDKSAAFTTAVNYGNQGNSSVVANEAFELAIMNIRALGIDVSAESVIHDSNMNNLPIKDLFEADLCYRKFFRQYTREKYGIDFKYDLDINMNTCEHMKYSLDIESKIGSISGDKRSVDYVFTYLKEPDITILEDNVVEQHSDPIGDFIKQPSERSHYICDYPEFLSPYKRTVKFKVNRHILGEETMGQPLGVPSYFNKVKMWSEHLIPGMKDDEELDSKGKSLHIKDNPNKIYPVDLMNKILAEGA